MSRAVSFHEMYERLCQRYAVQLGVPVETFKEAFDKQELIRRVSAKILELGLPEEQVAELFLEQATTVTMDLVAYKALMMQVFFIIRGALQEAVVALKSPEGPTN